MREPPAGSCELSGVLNEPLSRSTSAPAEAQGRLLAGRLERLPDHPDEVPVVWKLCHGQRVSCGYFETAEDFVFADADRGRSDELDALISENLLEI